MGLEIYAAAHLRKNADGYDIQDACRATPEVFGVVLNVGHDFLRDAGNLPAPNLDLLLFVFSRPPRTHLSSHSLLPMLTSLSF